MVVHAQTPYITPDEYLKREIESETRNEYVDGVIVAMAGASREHNRITRNTILTLEPHVRRAKCEAFATDLRVRLATSNRYYYPDYLVVCGNPMFEEFEGQDSLVNPTLIIEVISESTERRDRGEKLLAYSQFDPLRAYALVHQDMPLIEIYSRSSSARVWEFDTVEGLEAVLSLAVLDCCVPLSALYLDVEFTTPQTPYSAP